MRATQVKGGTCDQRRQAWHPARGCDEDAEPSGSWRRGESPYATSPSGRPGGVQVLGQVPARVSAGHVHVRCQPGPGQVQGQCSLGAREVLARFRLDFGQDPRGSLRVRPQVASGYKCPRGFGCVPPRSRVVPAINDVKRGTLREGATWTQCHLDRGAGVGVPPSHPHRSTRWG